MWLLKFIIKKKRKKKKDKRKSAQFIKICKIFKIQREKEFQLMFENN